MYTLIGSLLRFLSVVALSVSGFGLPAVFGALVLVAWVIAVFGVFDMLRLSPEGRFVFDGQLVRQQISFSLPLLATAIVGTASVQLDKILIATFFSPEMYAVYSCGAIELPVVGLITISLSSAIMPNLVQLVQQERKVEALNIWQEAARKSSLILFPCFVFFFLAGHNIVVLLYRESYSMAVIPFRIYLCALPLRIAIYATLFRALGQTRPIAMGAVLSITISTVVGFSLVTIGRNSALGFAGPAVGIVASYFAVGTFMLMQLSRALQVEFSKIMRWKELGTLFMIAALAGIAGFAIPLPNVPLLFKVIAQGFIYSGFFVGLLVSSNRLKEDEKALLMSPVRFLQTKLM
jgi:O-antigen/teichoic acid export membrane protein